MSDLPSSGAPLERLAAVDLAAPFDELSSTTGFGVPPAS
jgi:hypothetical protein